MKYRIKFLTGIYRKKENDYFESEVELEPVDDCPASECAGAECICGKLDNGDVEHNWGINVDTGMVSIDEVLKVFDKYIPKDKRKTQLGFALSTEELLKVIRKAIEQMKRSNK